jgi:glyoxylase-like metal-dependent hydrolase (beta-lactamase superfamily II)
VTEVLRGVHAIDLGMVFAYVYAEGDRLTLIDCGLADHASVVLAAVEGLGRRPSDLRQIVVTHYHRDHCGAAAELAERAGAQVLAHGLEAPVLRGEAEEEPPTMSAREREAFERITHDVAPLRPVGIDRELADGDEIDLDGGATVVHVPGHTAGSIAVYLPKRRALFVGDAAARMPDGQLIVGVFNADPAQARASFARLAGLHFEAAFFGHGAPMDKAASSAFRQVAERLAAAAP